ncbi:MAG: tetratricopeptide repeat protein [Synechococcaceae cyanobacterium SM2_3_1]|nr:tetratricopeptide repeat protein [Synechococcaceae cyanobacterium SM2_3_1]
MPLSKCMRRISVVLAMLLGLILPLSIPALTQSIDQLHNQGVQLYNEGSYEAASERFLAALKINPKAIAPLEYLGGSLLRLQRYQDAVDILSRALEINPYDADNLYDLGVAYDHLGELEPAAENYRKSAEEFRIRPESLDRVQPEEIYNNLGISQLAQTDYDTALSSFQQATSLNQKYGQGYFLEGLTYTHQADYPQAVTSFDQSVSPEVEFDLRERGYNGRGVAQYLEGQLQPALESLNTSIQEAERQNRTYSIAFANRGLTHFDLGDLEEAESDYGQVTILAPEDPLGFRDRGYVQYELAASARRIARSPDPLEVMAALPPKSTAYFQAHVDHYRQLLAQHLHPSLPQLVASLPFASGFLPPQPSLDLPLPEDPQNPVAVTRVALNQLAISQLEKAVTSYTRALELDTQFPDAHYGLAAVRRSQKQFQEALQEFERARDLYLEKGYFLWADFVDRLDIPALEARLAEPEPASPSPEPPAASSPEATTAPSEVTVRLGFNFSSSDVVKLLDQDQLDLILKEQALNNAVAPVVRREAVQALRLKQFRVAYPALQDRLAKPEGGEYKEPDRSVRSAILFFLEEVEAPPPPAPKAEVPIVAARPVVSRPPKNPVPNPVPAPAPPAAQPISQQRVMTTFNPPVKPTASGCGDDSIVSAAICRIRA